MRCVRPFLGIPSLDCTLSLFLFYLLGTEKLE